MVKKTIIQVPVDKELLLSLQQLSKKQHQTRSELIRQACLRYLKEMEAEELDNAYQQGYIKYPEAETAGESQEAMVRDIFHREDW
ncbi:MAG: ribbon-helix-helix protein, CopG family [Dehalococcoidaceae bacterium]|nr:ribbon-helix-helix protein, CopG family [Dehalococcoidaceae bacterium]